MNIRLVLAAAATLAALSAQAHTHLSASMPADKSVVMQSPDHIVLTFSEAARVTAVTLQKGTGAAQALGPLPGDLTREIRVNVPALSPGEYVVHWRVAGKDSHIMSGKFSFAVQAKSMAAGR